MGRSRCARQQPHEDCSPVGGPIIAQTKSRLTLPILRSWKRPPQVITTTCRPTGEFVKSRQKSSQNTWRNPTSIVSCAQFYWGTYACQHKFGRFATETRLTRKRLEDAEVTEKVTPSTISRVKDSGRGRLNKLGVTKRKRLWLQTAENSSATTGSAPAAKA